MTAPGDERMEAIVSGAVIGVLVFCGLLLAAVAVAWAR